MNLRRLATGIVLVLVVAGLFVAFRGVDVSGRSVLVTGNSVFTDINIPFKTIYGVEEGGLIDDRDKNGLSDAWTLHYFKADLCTDKVTCKNGQKGAKCCGKDADPDGDKLTNYQEFLASKTDPTKKDSDGDGFVDGFEYEFRSCGFDVWKRDGWMAFLDFDSDGVNNIDEHAYWTNPELCGGGGYLGCKYTFTVLGKTHTVSVNNPCYEAIDYAYAIDSKKRDECLTDGKGSELACDSYDFGQDNAADVFPKYWEDKFSELEPSINDNGFVYQDVAVEDWTQTIDMFVLYQRSAIPGCTADDITRKGKFYVAIKEPCRASIRNDLNKDMDGDGMKDEYELRVENYDLDVYHPDAGANCDSDTFYPDVCTPRGLSVQLDARKYGPSIFGLTTTRALWEHYLEMPLCSWENVVIACNEEAKDESDDLLELVCGTDFSVDYGDYEGSTITPNDRKQLAYRGEAEIYGAWETTPETSAANLCGIWATEYGGDDGYIGYLSDCKLSRGARVRDAIPFTNGLEAFYDTGACAKDMGVPIAWCNNYAVCADLSGDYDGDTLSNFEEYKQGTDPKNSDTDGDGPKDWAEVNAKRSPLIADEFSNKDSDGDKIPDWWEVKYGLDSKSDDASVDGDGDTLSNYEEYVLALDPTKKKTGNTDNADVLTDLEQVYFCVFLRRYFSGQGFENTFVNCMPRRQHRWIEAADADHDGLSDIEELRLLMSEKCFGAGEGPNPEVADYETYLTDPELRTQWEACGASADSDDDGLPDWWEIELANANGKTGSVPDKLAFAGKTNDIFAAQSSMFMSAPVLWAAYNGDNCDDKLEIYTYNDYVSKYLDVADYKTGEKSCEVLDDTDGDYLPDWWERAHNYGVGPGFANAGKDRDRDGRTTLQEYTYNEKCIERDSKKALKLSDIDEKLGLLPGTFDGFDPDNSNDYETFYGALNFSNWEDVYDYINLDVDYFGVKCSELMDFDADGLPDWWEYKYAIPISSPAQLVRFEAGGDPDRDNLLNVDEFVHKTNPRSWDTDSDGLSDLTEVNHNLDPLNPADAEGDMDGDGLDTLTEFKLAKDCGLRANDSTDWPTFLEAAYEKGADYWGKRVSIKVGEDTKYICCKQTYGSVARWVDATQGCESYESRVSVDVCATDKVCMGRKSICKDDKAHQVSESITVKAGEIKEPLIVLCCASSSDIYYWRIDQDGDLECAGSDLERVGAGVCQSSAATDKSPYKQCNEYCQTYQDEPYEGYDYGSMVGGGNSPSYCNCFDEDPGTKSIEVGACQCASGTEGWAVCTELVDYAPYNIQNKNIVKTNNFNSWLWVNSDKSDCLNDDEKLYGEGSYNVTKCLVEFDFDNDDGDNMTVDEEFNYNWNMNVSDPDTDGDGMYDGWEVDYGLNPLDPADAGLDGDGDGLTNLEEFNYSARVVDEKEVGCAGAKFNPTVDDYTIYMARFSDGGENSEGKPICAELKDRDGDELPDWWEVKYGLNPFNSADNVTDGDGDGLKNWEEYDYVKTCKDANFNPSIADYETYLAKFDFSNEKDLCLQLKDRDKDKLPDWWEVKYNLSSSEWQDNATDLDSDGLKNVEEYALSKYCLDFVIGRVEVFEGFVFNPRNGTDLNVFLGKFEAETSEKIKSVLKKQDSSRNDDYAEVECASLYDSDADGLPDWWEVEYFADASENARAVINAVAGDGDFDSDGLSNLAELNNKTNPTLADTDGDEMGDGWEVEHAFAVKGSKTVECLRPNKADASEDFNGDGLSNKLLYDLCVVDKITCWDPCDENGDSNDDGLPDVWVYRYFVAPGRSGVGGDVDEDGESISGDAVSGAAVSEEPSTGRTELRDSDPDKDGLTTIQEFYFGTDPTKLDSDGDGMADGWEVRYSKLDSKNDYCNETYELCLCPKKSVGCLSPNDGNDSVADFDGDGLTNAEEYALDFNPVNTMIPPTAKFGVAPNEVAKGDVVNFSVELVGAVDMFGESIGVAKAILVYDYEKDSPTQVDSELIKFVGTVPVGSVSVFNDSTYFEHEYAVAGNHTALLLVMIERQNDHASKWASVGAVSVNVFERALDAEVAADVDGDGVADKKDNCPYTANVDQVDSNKDKVGDACTYEPKKIETCLSEGFVCCEKAAPGSERQSLPGCASGLICTDKCAEKGTSGLTWLMVLLAVAGMGGLGAVLWKTGVIKKLTRKLKGMGGQGESKGGALDRY